MVDVLEGAAGHVRDVAQIDIWRIPVEDDRIARLRGVAATGQVQGAVRRTILGERVRPAVQAGGADSGVGPYIAGEVRTPGVAAKSARGTSAAARSPVPAVEIAVAARRALVIAGAVGQFA